MNFNTVLDNCKIYEAGKPIELVVREYGVNPKEIIKLGLKEYFKLILNNKSKVSHIKILTLMHQECLYMELMKINGMIIEKGNPHTIKK